MAKLLSVFLLISQSRAVTDIYSYLPSCFQHLVLITVGFPVTDTIAWTFGTLVSSYNLVSQSNSN